MWAADITYLHTARGFLYLVAVMDWRSRYVLAWRLSNTPQIGVGGRLWKPASAPRRGGGPGPWPTGVFNTDQGSRFTSLEFTQILMEQGVRISMDGKER